jgi:hypothetical protein
MAAALQPWTFETVDVESRRADGKRHREDSEKLG